MKSMVGTGGVNFPFDEDENNILTRHPPCSYRQLASRPVQNKSNTNRIAQNRNNIVLNYSKAPHSLTDLFAIIAGKTEELFLADPYRNDGKRDNLS